MIYSYFDFGLKNSSFRLPYQRHSSSADCARELFNASNGSASLVDCTRKKSFCLGCVVFCEWRHKWSIFGSNGSAGLVDCTWKKIFWLGVQSFCDWSHKWSIFGSFWLILLGLSPTARPKCFAEVFIGN